MTAFRSAVDILFKLYTGHQYSDFVTQISKFYFNRYLTTTMSNKMGVFVSNSFIKEYSLLFLKMHSFNPVEGNYPTKVKFEQRKQFLLQSFLVSEQTVKFFNQLILQILGVTLTFIQMQSGEETIFILSYSTNLFRLLVMAKP